MAGIGAVNLNELRRLLGKSQREMADLLGISTRAVQSYEQGWRSMPPSTQKLSLLFVFLRWRRKQTKVKPCWEVKGCLRVARTDCPVFQHRGGEFCWLISGNRYDGTDLHSWEAKLAKCQACPVMQRWMPVEPATPENGRATVRRTVVPGFPSDDSPPISV